MVRDGYLYAAFLIVASGVVGWLASPLWAIPALVLAAFFLWFFRDPERTTTTEPGALVSPADGKVTSISTVKLDDRDFTRISVFLNVFNVHVNRSPIAGVIREVRYTKGKFLNAMNPASADDNEQNMVTVEGRSGEIVHFKQIAGLLARRIVFNKSVGDSVARGERIGLIKFGSRVDIFFDTSATLNVVVGDHVKGGASVLGFLPDGGQTAATSSTASSHQGAR